MPLSRIEIKWYSKYAFLVGAILSFADPITDILTLVQFYREDHKTWFAVGLGFMFLPWVAFGYYYAAFKRSLFRPVKISANPYDETSTKSRRVLSWHWLKSFLTAFHPFSAAVARLKMFVHCLKDQEYFDNFSVGYSHAAAFFEAALESAPQFVIQLYVIRIQHERVSVIQLISLPVSFLSLVWTFTSTEKLLNRRVITDDIHVKHNCFLLVTNLFLVSSRLCAVGYFTVSFKWWIISVVMLHSIIMMIVGYISSYRQKSQPRIQRFMSILGACEFIFLKFCVQWIKDDLPFFPVSNKKTIRWVANALFVTENLVMILFFYFSGHSDTWYALPVTVCVCSFAVLGGITRITHFYVLEGQDIDTRNIYVDPHVQRQKDITHFIPSTHFQTFYYYETAV